MLLLAVLVTIGPSAFNKFGFGFRLYTDYGSICCATLGSRKTPDMAFSAYQFVCGRSHSCTHALHQNHEVAYVKSPVGASVSVTSEIDVHDVGWGKIWCWDSPHDLIRVLGEYC